MHAFILVTLHTHINTQKRTFAFTRGKIKGKKKPKKGH